MADFKDFLSTDDYLGRLAALNNKIEALAQMLSVGSHNNIPSDAIRWSQSQKRWEIYSGGTWGALEAEYNINVKQLKGAEPNTAVSNNSIVKRTSQGRIKAANPSSSDDVVTRGNADSRYVRQSDLGKDGGLTVENAKNADDADYLRGHRPQSSKTDTTEDRLMLVGAGGWLGNSDSRALMDFGYPENMSQNITCTFRQSSSDNGVSSYSAGIHFATGDTFGRLRVGYGTETPRAWIQGGNMSGAWTSRIILEDDVTSLKSGDSAQLNGQSASYYRNASNINAGTLNKARLPSGIDAATLGGMGPEDLPFVFGDGWEWADKTSSRSYGTAYVNSSGHPMQALVTVSVVSQSTDGVARFNMTLGGLTSGVSAVGPAASPNNNHKRLAFLSPVIRASESVRFHGGNQGKIEQWLELRRVN